jgi:hypothetical protein
MGFLTWTIPHLVRSGCYGCLGRLQASESWMIQIVVVAWCTYQGMLGMVHYLIHLVLVVLAGTVGTGCTSLGRHPGRRRLHSSGHGSGHASPGCLGHITGRTQEGNGAVDDTGDDVVGSGWAVIARHGWFLSTYPTRGAFRPKLRFIKN